MNRFGPFRQRFLAFWLGACVAGVVYWWFG